MSDMPSVIGIDVGRGDETAMWLRNSRGGMRGFQPGGRIHLSGKSNRYRYHVSRVVSDTQMSIAEHIRPSKGYARHVRGAKAGKSVTLKAPQQP